MAANKNSMTKQLYAEIKPQLKTPKDDEKVMKKYHYGKSTVQKIRNTKDWHDYEARTHRFGGYPRKNQPARPSVWSRNIYPLDSAITTQEALQSVLGKRAARYILLQTEYDDLKYGYRIKLRTASLVWLAIGLALGSALGAIIAIMARGK